MKGNSKSKLANKAQASIVGGVVAVLVVIVIGILVFWSVSDSIEISSSTGVAVHSDVNDTAETIFGLAPIIAIVLIASIILGVVTGFGSGGKGGL